MSIYKDKVLLITGGTDDAEHSLRLRKVGKILCIPSIQILHDNGQNFVKVQDTTSWREY